jgi:hypothetical protein
MPSSAMRLFKRVVVLVSGDVEFVLVAEFADVFDAGGAARRNVGVVGAVVGMEGAILGFIGAVMLSSVASLQCLRVRLAEIYLLGGVLMHLKV